MAHSLLPSIHRIIGVHELHIGTEIVPLDTYMQLLKAVKDTLSILHSGIDSRGILALDDNESVIDIKFDYVLDEGFIGIILIGTTNRI